MLLFFPIYTTSLVFARLSSYTEQMENFPAECVVESVCISGFPQFMNKIAGDSNLNINTPESQSLPPGKIHISSLKTPSTWHFWDHQNSPSHDKPFVPLTLPTCSCTSNRSAYGIKAWNHHRKEFIDRIKPLGRDPPGGTHVFLRKTPT